MKRAKSVPNIPKKVCQADFADGLEAMMERADKGPIESPVMGAPRTTGA